MSADKPPLSKMKSHTLTRHYGGGPSGALFWALMAGFVYLVVASP